MAQETTPRARRKKIEPLDYTVAAMAPALKGMTSFLDVPAEVVRSGNVLHLQRESGAESRREEKTGGNEKAPGDETYPAGVESSLPVAEVQRFSAAEVQQFPAPMAKPDSVAEAEAAAAGVVSAIRAEAGEAKKSQKPKRSPEDSSTPGDERSSGVYSSPAVVSLGEEIRRRLQSLSEEEVQKIAELPLGERYQQKLARVVSGTEPGRSSVAAQGAGSEEAAENRRTAAHEIPPGDETYTWGRVHGAGHAVAGEVPGSLVPGRGRSKVRRCVMAQDAHSLGEEAIYQIFWRSGRPETTDPNGSRLITIGAADLGMRANMAKKNVRQNISRLYEKLAIEVIEDFETVSSRPRTYRVFSYKQILERRRAAGLEYVLRNKGVVFCTAEGEVIPTSPGNEKTPGDERSLRPAVSKRQRHLQEAAQQREELWPVALSTDISAEDLRTVSEALNLYWTVDEDAAVQLVRSCRREQADAKAEEIAFFVREKLELIRMNRNVVNPTGLILSTVPKSFVGQSFAEFRSRRESQAQLAAEESRRREQEGEELRKWLREQMAACESIVNDESKSQQERDVAEARLRGYAGWNV